MNRGLTSTSISAASYLGAPKWDWQNYRKETTMPERPLAGVISWEQHRKDVEAAWHKATKKNSSVKKSVAAAATPEAIEQQT